MLETPITDRGLAWADDVLKGRVPACKRVVQAVRRFKKDLKRQDTDDFPFVFDAEAAERTFEQHPAFDLPSAISAMLEAGVFSSCSTAQAPSEQTP